MSENEARADTNEMPHMTFFAVATEDSTLPEMGGVDVLRSRGGEGRRWFVYPSAVLVCGWEIIGRD